MNMWDPDKNNGIKQRGKRKKKEKMHGEKWQPQVHKVGRQHQLG